MIVKLQTSRRYVSSSSKLRPQNISGQITKRTDGKERELVAGAVMLYNPHLQMRKRRAQGMSQNSIIIWNKNEIH